MASFRQCVATLMGAVRAGERHGAALRWPAPVREAEARATKLLVRSLSPAQRMQFEECQYFDVIGGKTGEIYRIRSGCQMNIERLGQGGQCVHLLCFAPKGRLPVGDVMLAQKIALELFEEAAIMVANKAPRCHPNYEDRSVWEARTAAAPVPLFSYHSRTHASAAS
jgi:hypothetical protein